MYAPALVMLRLRDAEAFFRNGISRNSSRFSGPEDLHKAVRKF